MNNNKDFSEQINELFEDLSLDEASKLIESELVPTEEEVRKEVIENINKNDIKVDDNILSEIRGAHGEEGVLDYLRQSYGLKAEDEIKQELEVVEPKQEVKKEEVKEDIPVVGPKDYQSEFINNLSGRLSKVLNQQGMRAKTNEQVGRVEADPDARIDAIQQQLNLLRGTVMESTMVSGIGQGGDGQGPGSGEVRLNRLDDVHIPAGSGTNTRTRTVASAGNKPNNGDILVWDDSIYPDGGWTTAPGDSIGGGISGSLEELSIVFGKVWSSTAVGANVPLYWNTQDGATNDTDPNTATGELVVASLSEFKYMVSVDAVPYTPDEGIGIPNVYTGTWHIVGGKLINGDPVPVITVQGTSADANLGPDSLLDANGEEVVYGVYFREGIDAAPIEPDYNTDNIIVGHFVGCRETAGPSAMYWGAAADYNDIVENGPSGGTTGDPRLVRATQSIYTNPNNPDDQSIIFTEDPSGQPIVATQIIACVGIAVDANDPNSDIDWEVTFANGASEVYSITLTRPRDTNQPPFEGPFLYAVNAPCVSGGLTRVRTDDVYLAKLDDLTTTFNELRVYGSLPVDLSTFEFQEDYNELLAEIALDLHYLKPTMLVAEYDPVDENVPGVPVYLQDPNDPTAGNIDGIHDLYVPIKGDLWLDPRDNTLRACVEVSYGATNPGQDRPSFSAEWVVVSGEDDQVTTDQVTLINTIRLYEFYSTIPGVPTQLSQEEFLELFPLSTQEDANLLNVELLSLLHEVKPTIHVTPDIYREEYALNADGTPYRDVDNPSGIKLFDPKAYTPKKGDIWIDSQYRMFICDYAPYNYLTAREIYDPNDGSGDFDYPYITADGKNFAFWTEVGAGAGEGAKVYIQRYHPEDARTGDLWIEDTTYFVFVLSPEGTWVALTGDASAMGRSFKIHVDENPPGEPRQGDCWYDTHYSDMKIYLQPSGAATGGWFPVSSSISNEVYETVYPESRTITALNYQVQELTEKLEELEQNLQQQNYGNQNFSFPVSDWTMNVLEEQGSDILDDINVVRGTNEYDGDPTNTSDPDVGRYPY